jgi:hypothetical protein
VATVTTLDHKVKRFEQIGSWIIKVISLVFLPVALFFYYDIDFYWKCELCLLYGCMIAFSVLALIVVLFNSFFKFKREHKAQHVAWTISTSLVLLSSFALRTEIMSLKEIIFFHRHREDFTALVDFAFGPESVHDQWGDIFLPEVHKEWTGSDRLFAPRGGPEETIQLIALYSRPDTYYTYLPNHRDLPKNYFYVSLGYGVGCRYRLADHWFVCRIAID